MKLRVLNHNPLEQTALCLCTFVVKIIFETLTGLKQKLSPNVAQIGFIRRAKNFGGDGH
jgi:hypothetical protein